MGWTSYDDVNNFVDAEQLTEYATTLETLVRQLGEAVEHLKGEITTINDPDIRERGLEQNWAKAEAREILGYARLLADKAMSAAYNGYHLWDQAQKDSDAYTGEEL